ncbi:MAG: AMP-binding protein [Spirochaetota bacterium]|nr:AMP-binding protein [Spirochaetota bacterium]
MQPSLDIGGDLIKHWSHHHPDKPAVIYRDQYLTWSKLYERSHALAQALYGIGLRPGDRAAVMIYNLPEYWEIYVALIILGVGFIPVGYKSKAPEIEYIVNNSESRCFLFHSDFARRILTHRVRYKELFQEGFICIGDTSLKGATSYNAIIDHHPTVDLSLLPKQTGETMIYTSGTTGKPKGASRSNIESMGEMLKTYIEAFNLTPDEIHLASCPLYHSAPLCFAGASFLLGGTLILMSRFKPKEFLKNIERHRVTSAFVVPIILNSLLKLSEKEIRETDLSSLRALVCGGATLSPKIKFDILDKIGPVLYEFYGSTETGINTIITPEEIRDRPNSVGKAMPFNELVILDKDGNKVLNGKRGELYIYNPFLIDGYYKNEQATQDCFRGKHITVGDIAIRDEDGYYYIVDRKKDMIIRGGVNIYPAEIEEVLNGMPGISDVAVIGLPNLDWGETVAAIVVCENDTKITEESIKTYCKERLAQYKIPESIHFRKQILRNPQGKILKRRIKKELLS